ncbi:MAG: TIR domain-containing protein [Eubacteriales bacterium]|nr:TIR domain-containing protein [Eubacteriales bacterium]
MKKELIQIPNMFQWDTGYEVNKVFLICHPEDRSTAAALASSVLFPNYDCDVYLDSSDRSPWEVSDLERQLSEMRFAVVPVTRNFLYDLSVGGRNSLPCYQAFFFAKEHGYPIVPVLMEKNLEKEFNQLCGAIQCFDPEGDTALWRNFLSNLQKVSLTSDQKMELTAGIRGRIFLSYRKKDHKQLERMKAFLNTHFLPRGVVAWCDDYLDLGESYNANIAEKLYAADLVLLLVTPSIYEPAADGSVNYVMAREYPEAVRRNIPVIPVLMDEGTELNRFACAFPGIDKIWDFSSEQSLFRQIMQYLPQGVQEPLDADEMWKIGRMLLMGEDVDQDVEHGLDYMMQAAKAGSEDAIMQVIDMYIEQAILPVGVEAQNGAIHRGTVQEYLAEWEECLYVYLQQVIRKPSDALLQIGISSVCMLAGMHARYGIDRSHLKRLLDFCVSVPEKYKEYTSPQMLYYASVACRELAGLTSQNDRDTACTYLFSAYEYLKQCEEGSENNTELKTTARKEILGVLYDLLDRYRNPQTVEQLMEVYQICEQTLQRYLSEEEDDSYKMDLGVICFEESDVYYQQGKEKEAYFYMMQSRAIYQELVDAGAMEESAEKMLQQNLVQANRYYNKRFSASLQKEGALPQDAVALYGQMDQRELRERILRDIDITVQEVSYIREHAEQVQQSIQSWIEKNEQLQREKRLLSAKQALDKAYILTAKYGFISGPNRKMADCCLRMAGLFMQLRDYEQADVFFRKAFAISIYNYKRNPSDAAREMVQNCSYLYDLKEKQRLAE